MTYLLGLCLTQKWRHTHTHMHMHTSPSSTADEPRVSCMLTKCLTAELHLQPEDWVQTEEVVLTCWAVVWTPECCSVAEFTQLARTTVGSWATLRRAAVVSVVCPCRRACAQLTFPSLTPTNSPNAACLGHSGLPDHLGKWGRNCCILGQQVSSHVYLLCTFTFVNNVIDIYYYKVHDF